MDSEVKREFIRLPYIFCFCFSSSQFYFAFSSLSHSRACILLAVHECVYKCVAKDNSRVEAIEIWGELKLRCEWWVSWMRFVDAFWKVRRILGTIAYFKRYVCLSLFGVIHLWRPWLRGEGGLRFCDTLN